MHLEVLRQLGGIEVREIGDGAPQWAANRVARHQ
jgi:hypothetical protein